MAVSRWMGVLVLLAIAGCAAQPKRDQVMLASLAAALQGSYDNIAQSRASAGHPALRMVIAPVHAPLVGDHVFYMQEMAADDARRVMAQRLYVLNPVTGREQAVLTQLDFSEPLRWRDGHLRRELFRGLMMSDLRVRAGCDLLWSREEEGYAATTGSGCRDTSRVTGETLRVEQRMQLDTDGLDVFEQHRDAVGTVVYGDETDPWYRYARRADAPWGAQSF